MQFPQPTYHALISRTNFQLQNMRTSGGLSKIALFILLCAAADVACLKLKAKLDIVRSHNSYRAGVKPEAANMLNMTWYEPASRTAQSWASKCKRLTHDDSSNRVDSKFGNCGQNIFISSAPMGWQAAVKAWYSEVSKFTFGSADNKFEEIGHYTQVVWAQTHKVGCGLAKCTDAKGIFFNYICNYCPAGNIVGQINTPYIKGTKCSGCPNSCLPNGLCAKK
ncbi:cysteine-rich venom protein pseudechetoxin-like [Neocloeon triangulifer]|uniref:cysteine-rich venom protein pseudechetoxin-like n=1 Tax=Neocloeon triangulifer TaxID=2078957 RepID=UPI00286F16DF|nr:cysteine-rich venom protein pseudechetoxin-like [Neocloeon triangulifer]